MENENLEYFHNEFHIDTDYKSYIEISCEEGSYFVSNFDDIRYINYDIRRRFDNSQVVRLDIFYSTYDNDIYMKFPIEDTEYANECYKIIKKILIFKEKNKILE